MPRAGFALITIGTLLAVGAWIGAQSATYEVSGLSYLISGGVGGALCIGIGVTLLVTARLDAKNRWLSRLTETLGAASEPDPNELFRATTKV